MYTILEDMYVTSGLKRFFQQQAEIFLWEYLLHRMWFNIIELEGAVLAVVFKTILGLSVSYLVSELFVKIQQAYFCLE